MLTRDQRFSFWAGLWGGISENQDVIGFSSSEVERFYVTHKACARKRKKTQWFLLTVIKEKSTPNVAG